MAEMPGDGGAAEPPGWPDWLMPPRMIGGHVTGPAVIGRSGGLVVAVRQVLAFPAGVEVEVEAHARRPPGGGTAPAAAGLAGSSPLRFRVKFADGREAAQDDEAGLRSGRGPMLTISGGETSSGGPDGREDVRLTLWIWPLPPPGPVTVTCSWPGRGLDGAGLVLAGGQVQAAACRAQPFWPQPSP
jgi:hypothetical protein